jgi:squalene-hopene/tetraprenyl-beta-curcumene cyclase
MNELRKTGLAVPEQVCGRAADFICQAQHPGGGWGGDKDLPETVEETALALEALCGWETSRQVESGLGRLLELIEEGRHHEASPIGFYFARFWYFERLYPLIFSVVALSAGQKATLK